MFHPFCYFWLCSKNSHKYESSSQNILQKLSTTHCKNGFYVEISREKKSQNVTQKGIEHMLINTSFQILHKICQESWQKRRFCAKNSHTHLLSLSLSLHPGRNYEHASSQYLITCSVAIILQKHGKPERFLIMNLIYCLGDKAQCIEYYDLQYIDYYLM